MSTEIFKVGDPVFDIRYGKGKVEDISHTIANPILVRFERSFESYNNSDIYMLSFTEYDLINGGWSQDRSVLNQPKRGDLVYVRDSENELWEMRYYSHRKHNVHYCFNNQQKNSSCKDWAIVEVENPLLKEKE